MGKSQGKHSPIGQHPDSSNQFQVLQRSLGWEIQEGSQILFFQFLFRLDINLESEKHEILQTLENVDQSHDQFGSF